MTEHQHGPATGLLMAGYRVEVGPAQAWQAFRHAQQDNPADPALGMLEAQLLLAEGKTELARERARFHLGQLRRRGEEVDAELLEFCENLARDPGRAMADVAIDIEGGAGRRLAAWIERIAERALNPRDNHGLRYRLAGELLHDRDDAGCLQLAARYPDDPAPELRFNEALAHYRLGQAKSATAALQRAYELNPTVARLLLPRGGCAGRSCARWA